jgi:predicted ATP-grasp superfamily ATP-dependent carboligase
MDSEISVSDIYCLIWPDEDDPDLVYSRIAEMRKVADEQELTGALDHVAACRSVGALVVGGDHPGLAIARSLGRRNIPVYVIDSQRCISSFSKYATKVMLAPDLLDERKTVDAVLEAGRRFNLRNWVLFPTRDETVSAFARHRTELSDFFRVTTPDWSTVCWASDKKRTYELAENLGIPCPQTFNPKSSQDLEALYPRLPLAIKPAIKENFYYSTGAKAWRANTAGDLHGLYEKARQHISPEEILVQEIIPGDGRDQYSYCAFVQNGKPHSTLTARRARQYPREFGRSASYVETVDLPEIEELSERFLIAIDYSGIVEIEFKRDSRDGAYKLLDVNPRAWGFHALGAAVGIDFPYLLFANQLGITCERVRAKAGIGWLRLLTDVPTALSSLFTGNLTLGTYIKSLRSTRVEAVFSKEDPLPSLGEIALLPYLIAKKFL